MSRGPVMSRAAAVLLASVLALACGPASPIALPNTEASSVPSASSPTATPVPTGTETLAPVASESATPTPLANIAQAEPAVTYSPPPPPTPWPTVAPGLWRWQGVVVDPSGQPVDGVCIAVGPHGCQPSSPRTDARGAWYIDFPQAAAVSYDLHFAKDGFQTFDVRVTPTSGWTLDVTLKE